MKDVLASLRRKLLGGLLAEGFKLLYGQVMKLNVHRDDERHWVDRSTFTIKRTYRELNRRLVERGPMQGEHDFYFLSLWVPETRPIALSWPFITGQSRARSS